MDSQTQPCNGFRNRVAWTMREEVWNEISLEDSLFPISEFLNNPAEDSGHFNCSSWRVWWREVLKESATNIH